jgi:hypothetical protein
MNMIVKLSANTIADGTIFLSASQNSALLFMSAVGAILRSMIKSVNAIANTPSQKHSSRAL